MEHQDIPKNYREKEINSLIPTNPAEGKLHVLIILSLIAVVQEEEDTLPRCDLCVMRM